MFLESLVSLVPSVASGSYALSATSSAEFPEPWDLMSITFRTDGSEALTLHIVWVLVSVFVLICCRRKVL